MTPHGQAEQEPPGEPRETPWQEPGQPTIPPPPTEPPGEPREAPWVDPPGEQEGAVRATIPPPASEPPGDPRELPWPDPEREQARGVLGRLRRWAQG